MERGQGLGWFPSNDRRRLAYPMRAAPDMPKKPVRRNKHWYAGWRGDQGNTSQCVAYGSLHLYHASPFTYPKPRPRLDPEWLYDESQKVDPWEGEDYDGTSSDAAFMIMKREGLIESFWWAESFEEAISCLSGRSPVCFGTVWKSGMDEPDEHGFIYATGFNRGGHLYCGIGVNFDKKVPGTSERGAVRILQSWDWARAWISLRELEGLFNDGGEAVLVVERT